MSVTHPFQRQKLSSTWYVSSVVFGDIRLWRWQNDVSCHNHKFTIEQQQQAEKITHSSFLSVLLSFNTIFRCYCARLFITSSYQEMECMYFRRNQLLFISRHSNYISHTCERWMTKQSSHSHRTANWNWCALLTRKTWAFFISIYRITKWERVRQEIQWGQWW